MKVYFEQPAESGFNLVECTIPEYKWEKNKGFNEEQLKYLDKYLHDVEDIIFELAAVHELQKVALAQVRVLVGLYQQNNKQMF